MDDDIERMKRREWVRLRPTTSDAARRFIMEGYRDGFVERKWPSFDDIHTDPEFRCIRHIA